MDSCVYLPCGTKFLAMVLLFEGTFTSFIISSYFLSILIEGSGSVSLTNGSGSTSEHTYFVPDISVLYFWEDKTDVRVLLF
jgi:hypothetical protein